MTQDNNETYAPGRIPVLMMAQKLGWGGGIERDISKFARHVADYGIDAHVACFQSGGVRWSEIENAGIPIVRIPVTSFKSPSIIFSANVLRRYITEHKICIVHAFDKATMIFGISVARLMGIPALASQVWCRNTLPRSCQIWLSMIDRVASGIFVNSYAVANELVTSWRVRPDRIHICQNGFESSEFHAHGRERPASLQEASVIIGTVAVLREEKNLPLLLDAFVRVQAVDPRAKLVVVGDGPVKSDLVNRAERLGISNACLFQAATPNPAEWMRAIDIFVLCSRSESFPNALLEAMACGCCPIVSRVGGTTELVTHEKTGLMFESGDVSQLADILCRLIHDHDSRSRFANAATRFAHGKFTIDIASARLAEIYKQVSGRATSARGEQRTAALDLSKTAYSVKGPC